MMEEVPHRGDDVLNAEEAAGLLGLDVLQVRRLVLKGKLPAYRLPGGRKYKFFRGEVEAFVAYLRVEEAAAADEEAPSGVSEVPAEPVPASAPAAGPEKTAG